MIRQAARRGWVLAVLLLGLPAAAAQTPGFTVIVHPSNSIVSISRIDLERIYRREVKFWPDGRRVIPINAPSDSEIRARFTQKVLRTSFDALVTYWNRKYFRGETPPAVLKSSDAIRAYVAQRPEAIGYVSAGSDLEGVRELPVRFDD